MYLASEEQKQSNATVPDQNLATKVSKSRAIPPYIPKVNPPGWPLISAITEDLLLGLQTWILHFPIGRKVVELNIFSICVSLQCRRLIGAGDLGEGKTSLRPPF